jgi:hypothetical protein
MLNWWNSLLIVFHTGVGEVILWTKHILALVSQQNDMGTQKTGFRK